MQRLPKFPDRAAIPLSFPSAFERVFDCRSNGTIGRRRPDQPFDDGLAASAAMLRTFAMAACLEASMIFSASASLVLSCSSSFTRGPCFCSLFVPHFAGDRLRPGAGIG